MIRDGHIHLSMPLKPPLKKTSVDFLCTAERPYDLSKAPNPKVRWLNVWHEASYPGWVCKHCGLKL